jgi:hypothetical protein
MSHTAQPRTVIAALMSLHAVEMAEPVKREERTYYLHVIRGNTSMERVLDAMYRYFKQTMGIELDIELKSETWGAIHTDSATYELQIDLPGTPARKRGNARPQTYKSAPWAKE